MSLGSLDELTAPSALPEDHDPLANGILMAHQAEWVDDKAPLKLAAKGRRTGITYAEALDDTMIASAAPSAGGDNVYYIGDTKEKGLEFIRYVAHFARVVAEELHQVEEFLFEDKQRDGTTSKIGAYRIRFASGFQVVALSSRPANIRGLQGVVVIDEAAFHADVGLVIEAVNALLIWGGKIRIISSHNGEDNPFNQLIKDTGKGLYDYSIHHIPFSLAVKNGLYERVCLMRGWTPTPEAKEAWLQKILRSYGPRHEARDEELEAIPRRSAGAYLPRNLVAAAQIPGVPVLMWEQAEDWFLDEGRLDQARLWLAANALPVLLKLDPRRRHAVGQDMGRDGDLSVIVIDELDGSTWRTVLQIEMRRIPFDVQWEVLDFILSRLTRWHAQFDARGNGQAHAEKAVQHYGARAVGVKATAAWYATHFPTYKAALEDKSKRLPQGEDVLTDHLSAVLANGFPTMSPTHRAGQDGQPRHGDCLVAHLLAHVAGKDEDSPMEFQGLGRTRAAMRVRNDFMGQML